MFRELFTIPLLNLPVYGYGLMLVLGVWASAELSKYLANRLGMNGDDFVTLCLVALVSGVVGARVSHILENLGTYTDPGRSAWDNFTAAINITSGGLTFYGGFIMATFVAIGFGKLKGIPIRLGMDVIAPCLMFGLAFGRIGCLLNGCCWGQVCDRDEVPWAITFPYASPPYQEHFEDGDLPIGEDGVPQDLIRFIETKQGDIVPVLADEKTVAADERLTALAGTTRSLPVHPTQLYSVLNALLLSGLCLTYLTTRPAPGRVFGLMLMTYGPARFVIESLRVNTRLAGDLTYSMWVSVIVTTAGVLLFALAGRMASKKASARSITSS